MPYVDKWSGRVESVRDVSPDACAELWSMFLRHLATRIREINDEVARYPRPIARCDVQLSNLLEEASRGNEIIITSDGVPKAKLGPVHMKRKRFKVNWELLRSMPVTTGPTAEQLIREDRDGRP